jgi:mRNA-degrading endonuclease toxin of MazEF toxin-antitoxin module
LLTQLKLNSPGTKRQPLKKWQIYVVHYGMNTGSEINGDRPAIIYKDVENTGGDDITVIPLTSAVRQKQPEKHDVFVTKDKDNKLFQDSFARVRQLRAVSVKRLSKLLGTITDEKVIQEINSAAEKMLATDK